MTGLYETYILVKVKGGRQYVCAMNRPKPVPTQEDLVNQSDKKQYQRPPIVWH